MQTSYKNILKLTFAILVIIVVILIVIPIIWLYSGPLTPAKVKLFSLVPFPIASVNGNFIPVSKFIFRYSLNQKLANPAAEQNISDELISEKKTELVAESKDVGVSDNQIEQDYQAASIQANLQGQKDFDGLLKSYGISLSNYKSEVIRPELLLINLRVWFYSQGGLNQSAYGQADSLVQKIKKGDNMGTLAAANSQQDSDKATQGDLGFVNVADLLPELREQVAVMNVGDVKIIPSRYGLHVLKLEEKKDNQVHLRQIFIAGSDFQAWYNNETKNYKVSQLIKIAL